MCITVMTAVHLERNVSFSVTGSNGIITRWHPQHWSPSIVESVELGDHNSSLIIPSAGLYLIYAQVLKVLFLIIHLTLICQNGDLVVLRGNQGK